MPKATEPSMSGCALGQSFGCSSAERSAAGRGSGAGFVTALRRPREEADRGRGDRGLPRLECPRHGLGGGVRHLLERFVGGNARLCHLGSFLPSPSATAQVSRNESTTFFGSASS